MDAERRAPGVARYLAGRGARVLPEWVSACAAFLLAEVPRDVATDDGLARHAWLQLLESDLRDVALPALPPGADGLARAALPGTLVLQVIDVMEVQHSKQAMLDDVEKELEGRKYGGYQRIYLNVDEQEGNENADANGPARPGPTQNPAPSQAVVHNVTQTHQAKLISFPRGMLRLTLTDGHQVIEGMEMKRLPDVSMYTPLGSKVAITNATLRRGVLELTPNNFAFLGGFIEGMNGPDPLVDIRRKLRAALGKPPATDDDAVSRPMNLPPPPPDPVAPAAPQAGRNAAARPPGNPPPATQHNRQPPPQPPPRQPAPPFPQNNRPPLAPGAQHPRIGTPGFEDFPLDDFGVDDSFDIEDEPPPRAPPPVRQAAPPVRQPPPPRQPAPMPRQPQPPERQPQPPDRHRTPSKAAPGSQKTPQRDCARLWGFQNEQSHSPAQPLPPSSLPVSQQRTPVQERQPPEWEFDADDGLWNELDPDALALSGPGPGGPAAVPSTPLGPRGGTASQSYVDLDDIPDDLLLAMDQLSQKKAPQAPAGTQARPVVNLVDDEEETAGSGRGRTLVQARPPPPASSKQAPKPGLPFAQPLLPRETHAIGDLPNVIRERLAATVWLDNVAIVWYSPFRIVKGSSELELIVIVRDGSGDLAVKLPERILAQWVGFSLRDVQQTVSNAAAKEQMWENVFALQDRMLSIRMSVKLDIRPTWPAVNLRFSAEGSPSEEYKYLPVALECHLA